MKILSADFEASAASLPLTTQRNGSRMDVRRASEIRLPVEPEEAGDEGTVQAFGPDRGTQRLRTASIPASPMSDQSLTVLSCSVPFLRSRRISMDG